MRIRTQILLFFFVTFGAILIGGMMEYRKQIPATVLTRSVTATIGEESTVHLLAFGDAGSGDNNQKAVAELAERLCTDLHIDGVLFLGDNFYVHGVAGADDMQWQQKFAHMYGSPCLSRKKFFSVLGNHDYEGNALAQIEYTKKDPRWVMPARFYKISFSRLLDVFALDTNFPEKCFSTRCSIDWAQEELSKSEAAWRIVIGHHPLHSGGRYEKPKWLLRRTLPFVYCHERTDFVISGHDHSLQHLVAARDESCKFNQFISGGGGGELYPVKALDEMTQFAKSDHGLLSLTLTGMRAEFAFYTVNSPTPVYTYTQERNP